VRERQHLPPSQLLHLVHAGRPERLQDGRPVQHLQTGDDADRLYDVCGSATNLGSDCDPTIGKNCPGTGVCIDGYCH